MAPTRWLEPSEQHAWRTFITGVTALLERLDRELRTQHDVSLAEYEIMVRLSEAPQRSLRMAELAASVSHSRSRTTHTVARMESDGIVERRACPNDGRGVMAVLTDAGWACLVSASPTHVRGVRAHLVDVCDPADLRALGRVFDAVHEANAVPGHLD
ncbi:MAG: MarR family transcriptional regulator [Actinomycetota bacterium]|nr:MarR family transcriptional regulator [Actinomycetota bacterium]